MNKYFYFFVLALSISTFDACTQCNREANEIGEDSIFYYLNGNETVPQCQHTLISVIPTQDTMQISLCINYNYIQYTLHHFNGAEVYYFDHNSNNTCTTDTLIMPVYKAADDRNTYLRILEFNQNTRKIRGLFGAHLVNANNPNDTLIISKGRFDLNY